MITGEITSHTARLCGLNHGGKLRMLTKGMGVEYTQTAMDDNTWKCEHDTRLKKARRSAAGLQTKTLQSIQGKLR